MMDRKSLYHWLALNRISGLGKVGYVRLLEKFGTPEQVFRADLQGLLTVEGIRKNVAQAITKFKRAEKIDQELDELEKAQIGVLTFNDPRYPALLAKIHDPPPLLYFKGNPSERDDHCLALVGSRLGTPYGIKTTERLAWGVSQQGFTVVSGMARGIDTSAHQGALMAQGRTVAVLGSGLDIIYPPENEKLFQRIIEQGMVCSEFPLGTLPERQNFPIRNRIISGMSMGVVIVEATQRSGSLITARLALDQGREVFAVPGSVDSFKSSGTNSLIKQGAKLVEHVQDILAEIPWEGRGQEKTPELKSKHKALDPLLSTEEKTIWDLLTGGPRHVDEMVRLTGSGIPGLLALLLQMELKGWIKQLPGKIFTRA
ncbi:MAG: DNA-processing protein DprA [Thermodesulfobacteriota bacterium]